MTGVPSHDLVVEKGLDEMIERPLAKDLDIWACPWDKEVEKKKKST